MMLEDAFSELLENLQQWVVDDEIRRKIYRESMHVFSRVDRFEELTAVDHILEEEFDKYMEEN